MSVQVPGEQSPKYLFAGTKPGKKRENKKDSHSVLKKNFIFAREKNNSIIQYQIP